MPVLPPPSYPLTTGLTFGRGPIQPLSEETFLLPFELVDVDLGGLHRLPTIGLEMALGINGARSKGFDCADLGDVPAWLTAMIEAVYWVPNGRPISDEPACVVRLISKVGTPPLPETHILNVEVPVSHSINSCKVTSSGYTVEPVNVSRSAVTVTFQPPPD